MPVRQIISLIFFFTVGASAFAASDIKTTYSISGSSATATTTISGATADQEKMMRGYLFNQVAKKLKSFPNVSSIEYANDIKGENSTASYQDYWDHKRKFPVFVRLSLPASVTLMMRVEESYRTCKSPAEKGKAAASSAWDEGYDTSSPVDCSLDAAVKVTGPYAVYGNFASSLNIERLLKDRQELSFDISRDYSDKTAMKVVTRFNINSELFDRGLLKFLDAFNVKLDDGSGSAITRNYLLVGIARILRVNNERLVE